MSLWTEVRILLDHSPDDALLVETLAPLIEMLHPKLKHWHHVWEPDLWVRLQWRTEGDQDAGRERVRASLDAAQLEWSFDAYDARADETLMGAEMAAQFHDDMQRDSERALRIAQHERAGTLTKDRDFHWARRMHTSTNQLYGTWTDEYRLCLEQARYRAWLLSCGKHTDRPTLASLVQQLDTLLTQVDALRVAEQAQLDAWRAAKRPDITTLRVVRLVFTQAQRESVTLDIDFRLFRCANIPIVYKS